MLSYVKSLDFWIYTYQSYRILFNLGKKQGKGSHYTRRSSGKSEFFFRGLRVKPWLCIYLISQYTYRERERESHMRQVRSNFNMKSPPKQRFTFKHSEGIKYCGEYCSIINIVKGSSNTKRNCFRFYPA